MVNQELLNYVKQQLQQGRKRAEIEEELLRAGWQEKAIEEAFNALGPPRPPAATPLPSASSQAAIGQQKLDPKAVWVFFLRSLWVALFLAVWGGIFLGFFLGLGFLVLVIVLILIGLAYGWAVMSYNAYRYELTQEGFKKESGVIWKKYVTIPYERIQNVDIHRGVIARMLGLSELQIFTAGMGGTKAEGELPGLSTEMAEQLSAELVRRAKSTRSGV